MGVEGLSQYHHLWLYTVLLFGVVVLPGMDMAFVLASSVSGGRRSGFAALGGIVAGGVAHLLLAALGVGLLLQRQPALARGLLVAGSIYVAWIGGQILRHAGTTLSADATLNARSHRANFVRGMTTSLTNPKAYAFMIAVFPQFLRPEYGSLVLQSALLGLIAAVIQLLIYGSVALLAARLRERVLRNARAQWVLGVTVGILLLLTAAWALWRGLMAPT
jgi:threonine/homoserine/homoserine lactone efflux protein